MVFASLVTDDQTGGQMSIQIQNIMPLGASLAWLRHKDEHLCCCNSKHRLLILSVANPMYMYYLLLLNQMQHINA